MTCPPICEDEAELLISRTSTYQQLLKGLWVITTQKVKGAFVISAQNTRDL